MKIHVFKIQWDFDGDEFDIPTEMVIDVPEKYTEMDEIEEYISDKISEESGWCHFGFDYQEIN